MEKGKGASQRENITDEGERRTLERPGRVDSSKYNTITNKYPDKALPPDGKIVDYAIIDGKIKVSNGTRYFDFVVDKDGKLTSIDNGSEHYRPSAIEMEVYPSIFKELGMDIRGTWVKTYDKSGTYIEKIFQLNWNQGDS